MSLALQMETSFRGGTLDNNGFIALQAKSSWDLIVFNAFLCYSSLELEY